MPLSLVLALPLLAADAGATTPSPTEIVAAAYARYCALPDSSQAAVLALADRDGWRIDGFGAPIGLDPSSQRFIGRDGVTLKLVTSERTVAGEVQDSCGISTTADLPDLVDATSALLGFAPAVGERSSATFFALHDAEGWHEGAGLDREAFVAAKARGQFFSVMTMSGEAGSSLFSLRFHPAG